MRSSDEIREERRRYEGDVIYEVWRRGGNVDRVDMDRVDDYYYGDVSAGHAAGSELKRQRPEPEIQEEGSDAE